MPPMTSNITLIFSAFLSYIVIFLALKNYKNNRILNFFLLFIFLISSTRLMIGGIAEIYNIADLKTFSIKINIYITLLLPSFYIYFKYLIKDHKHIFF